MKFETNNLSKTEVEFEVEVPAEEFKRFIDKALMDLGKDLEIKGFRKGKAPHKVIEEHFGSEKVLVEAADLAVNQTYRRAVLESKVDALFNPDIKIKKLAKGDNLVYTAKTSIIPRIELPDYQKIASKKKKNKTEVEEKEIERTLDWLRKSRAKFSLKNGPAENGDFIQIEFAIESKPAQKDNFILGQGHFLPGFEEQLIGMKGGEEKNIKLDIPKEKALSKFGNNVKVKVTSVQKMELAELNDDFVKSLGKFTDLDSLKKSIKDGIAMEKEQAEIQRIRNEILDQISKSIKVDLPDSLIKQEQEQMLQGLKNQASQTMKIPFDQYLEKIKKKEKDVLDSLKQEAEKKIKRFFILREIGKKENIQVSDQEVQDEVNKTLARYSSVEEAEKHLGVDLERFKDYTREVIKNEKIFKILTQNIC